MEKIRVNLCTTNAEKYKELAGILGDAFEVRQQPVELVEIQGNAHDIVTSKALEAYGKLKEPLFVDDAAVYFNAFNGLPGPYVKDFVMALGSRGMYRMLKDFEDKSARAVCNLCFTDGETTKVFEGVVEGRIVEPRGSSYGWNPIFQMDGSTVTFGELPREERNKISHRFRAAKQLKEFLLQYYAK